MVGAPSAFFSKLFSVSLRGALRQHGRENWEVRSVGVRMLTSVFFSFCVLCFSSSCSQWPLTLSAPYPIRFLCVLRISPLPLRFEVPWVIRHQSPRLMWVALRSDGIYSNSHSHSSQWASSHCMHSGNLDQEERKQHMHFSLAPCRLTYSSVCATVCVVVSLFSLLNQIVWLDLISVYWDLVWCEIGIASPDYSDQHS